MRVAVVGHTEWIWFGAVDRIPGPGEIAHATGDLEEPGGGGAVAAVQLAKLAGGCDFFTALGDDVFGERTRARLAELGVTVHAATRTGATRRALTLVDPAGERTITTLGLRLAPHADDPLPWDRLADAAAVFVTAGDAGAFAHARRARTMVVTTRVLQELISTGVAADALVGSARDARERVEVGALSHSVPLIVRTEGVDGGSFTTADGVDARYGAAVDVAVPDPGADAYGAGDSFAAGLTFALGRGAPVADALTLAARCGAACATGAGPYTRQLTIADI
ncbi:MAG TPA: PfkB family carbohydrate kinase [Actinomycetota bacterium]